MRSLLLVLVIATSQAAPLAQTRPPVRLNPNSSNAFAPNAQDGVALAMSGSRVVVAWADQNGTTDLTQDIYVAVSNDEGLTFGPPRRVDLGDAPNATDSEEPSIAITANGTIVCLWEDRRDEVANGGVNEDIFFSRSTDGGVTWLAQPIRLNGPTAGANILSDCDRAMLAVSGNTVYAIWEQNSRSGIRGPEEIMFARSLDAGLTWSAPRILTSAVVGPTGVLNDVDDPKIVVDGQTVAIAFIDNRALVGGLQQDDCWVLVSRDGGQTFTERSLETAAAGDADEPQIAISGSVICVVWADNDPAVPGGSTLQAAVSRDAGVTWSTETTLSPAQSVVPGASIRRGDVAISGSDILTTFSSDHLSVLAGGALPVTGSDGSQAYVSISRDAGLTWTRDIPLRPGATTPASRTTVAITPAMMYVHFELGLTTSNQLAYAWSRDRGVTWQTQTVTPVGSDVDSADEDAGRFFVVSPTNHTAVSVYYDNVSGANEIYVSAVRAPHVFVQGALTQGRQTRVASGSQVRLGVQATPSIAPAGSTFLIGLGTSGSRPSLPIRPGLLLHLVPDATTSLLLAPAFAGLVSGTVGANGTGTALPFAWPVAPPGAGFDAVGIILSGGQITYATDPVRIITN